MSIDAVRKEIRKIDHELIDLISRRQNLAARLAPLKHAAGLPIHDEAQKTLVLEHVFNRAVEKNIDPVHVQRIFEILMEMSEERQRGCSGEGNLP
jgi:chorismate mutase